MKFEPPVLTEGPLSRAVFVVTHGKVLAHPTRQGETLIEASVKYDITDQFEALASARSDARRATASIPARSSDTPPNQESEAPA